MRLDRYLIPLLILVGARLVEVSVAQDTNFAVGPQYLVTSGNPTFLRPIATPSLSLGGETLAGTSEVPHIVESPAFAPAETIVYLGNVYWGDHKPEEILASRLETPSATPEQTALYMNAVANQSLLAPAPPISENAVNAGPSVIELTGGPLPANLPASFLDLGVTGMTDAQSLLRSGYGVSLGEVAAYWKARKRQAPRVFTNQDLRRR